MHRIAAVVLLAAVALGAHAQSFPAKPVHLIVTYPPGGSSDLMARVFGHTLSEVWGQQVIIESKPGAAGSIGMEYAARQPADGYSFVIGNLGPAAVNPVISKVGYDVERDFIPVSLIATGPNVLVVNPSVPVKTLQDLIELARTIPGKLNYGTSGPGSVAQLSGAMFKVMTGAAVTEVPYKGGVLAVQDLVAGHIQYMFSDALPAMQFIRSGKLRAVAITGPGRSALVPDVPACAESGLPNLVAVNWWGVLVPAGTPGAIVSKYHDDLVKVLAAPEVKQKFADLGVEAVSSTPQAFGAFIKSEAAKYAKLIKDSGIKIEQ